jgi:hypothetical protein
MTTRGVGNAVDATPHSLQECTAKKQINAATMRATTPEDNRRNKYQTDPETNALPHQREWEHKCYDRPNRCWRPVKVPGSVHT